MKSDAKKVSIGNGLKSGAKFFWSWGKGARLLAKILETQWIFRLNTM